MIADLKNGPLAHLPSGTFTANAAWLVLAVMAFNLTRAAGCLAVAKSCSQHARATTGTLRTELINLPARLARSGRQAGYKTLFTAATCPPTGSSTRP